MKHLKLNFLVSFLLVNSIFIIQIFLVVLLVKIAQITNITLNYTVAALITIFPYILFLIIFLRNRIQLIQNYIKNLFPLFLILPILSFAIGLFIILSEIDSIFQLIIPMPDVLIELFHNNKVEQAITVFPYIISNIFKPIAKISFFLLVIYQGQLNYYNKTKSFIFTSLLFAISIYTPWSLFIFFFYSLAVLWIFDKYNSIFPCIIIELTFSISPLLLSMLPIHNIHFIGNYEFKNDLILQPFWYDISGLLLLILGFVILNWQCQKQVRSKQNRSD